jgi:oligopeptide transport system substrate-binding protein
MWASALGVNVAVADQDWTAYLETTNRTRPVEEAYHIFRMGWCADYPDENNWLREVFHYQDGTNRVRRRCAAPDCAGLSGPAVFDRLVIEAAREPDPNLRRELYARAEDILAREEVVAAFLFHGGANYVTKPWLHRDYASADGAHWYAWTIDWEVKKAAR